MWRYSEMGEYKMKRIIIVILLALSLVGCSTKENKDVNSSNDYRQIMEEKEYIVIDVRTKEEYDEGHVKGSINIPYDEINKDSEKEKKKVVTLRPYVQALYCITHYIINTAGISVGRKNVRKKRSHASANGMGATCSSRLA